MHKTFQSALFYIIVFTLTYFLYVYPFEILNEFILLEKEERRTSFLYTIVISSILVLYYRYQNKFKYLKFLVNEGVAIGIISFVIANILQFLKFFIIFNTVYAGLISIIIILVIFILSYYFNLVFNVKRFINIFNDIMKTNIQGK